MRHRSAALFTGALLVTLGVAWVATQQAPAPPPPAAGPAQFPPLGTGLTPVERALLQSAVDQLGKKVAALKAKHPSGPLADRVADVEIYLDAVRRPLKYDERLWAPAGSTPLATALQTLSTGAERAGQLAAGTTPWMTRSGVRGFYSEVDGSAQPYLLTMPDAYDPAATRPYRLDLFLHGRDDTVLEQQFMAKSITGYTSKPLRAGPDRFMLQPYSRYTNASRFAGETDGLEAIESVAKEYLIDRNRIVMAGFSMGGAAAWSFIVHHADRWAAGAPGAGFTETEVFLRGGLARQPQNAVQRTLWHMYDSTDYAVNAFNLPVVAYSGGNDPQKQAADAMAAAMLQEGLTFEHIIGPDTGHAYEPRARQQVQDRLDAIVEKGRNPVPKEIRFTTWLLRYNRMFWLTIDGMGAQWQRARVDARLDAGAVRLTTDNVTALHLTFAAGQAPFEPGVTPSATLDGTTITLPPVARDGSLSAGLVKAGESWRLGELPSGTLRKAHGLQGPIDDAFMASFLMVQPSGSSLSPALGRWAKEQADYAISEWVHFFRGEPRVKADTAVTAADIAAHNLVLFGDPSSNAIYKRLASRLPIRWTAAGVVVGGQTYSPDHAPVLVFPNPLNPKKYVVINSGFTFHDQSNNDMQSPKLPDWAVVDITKPGNNYRYLPLHVAAQGFFDEAWRLKGASQP
ncbi:MAG: prolyl oligopeptidase family serine peptidase [Vicinamibacterales bacterium]